jgi:hypothetical protein
MRRAVFVRRKNVSGNTYYQLVRNYREDGKHRQQVLCHLGQHESLETAIATERTLAEDHELKATFWSDEAQFIKTLCFEKHAELLSGDLPSRRQVYARWRAVWNTPQWTSLEDEVDFRDQVYEYHRCREEAHREEKRAATHRTQLNKFLECQRKYF